MRTIDVEEVKIHLAELVEHATKSEAFIIAVNGKPLVKVASVGIKATENTRRLGFLTGEIIVPSDFDSMGRKEIAHSFYGNNNR